MFGGDIESILQPVLAIGVGAAIGGIFVLSVAFSIGYIVYLQTQKSPSDH
jgi:hypothetical protein